MKKLTSYCFIFGLFLSGIKPAYSFCSYETACKLSDLQQQATITLEFKKAIDEYFNKGISSNDFFKPNYKNTNYNDLFIYNTIVWFQLQIFAFFLPYPIQNTLLKAVLCRFFLSKRCFLLLNIVLTRQPYFYELFYNRK